MAFLPNLIPERKCVCIFLRRFCTNSVLILQQHSKFDKFLLSFCENYILLIAINHYMIDYALSSYNLHILELWERNKAYSWGQCNDWIILYWKSYSAPLLPGGKMQLVSNGI